MSSTSDFLHKNTNRVSGLVLSLLVGFYIVVLIAQEGIVDTADGILHYQYARHTFSHVENVFNQWAKPIFTLLAAGPAQAGLVGIKVMNVVFIVVSARMAYLSAKHLNIRNPWLAMLFVGFGDSITYTVMGGLTEPTFMLAFSLIIYCAVTKRWTPMYILVGSLALIRPEAIVAIPVWGLFGIASAGSNRVTALWSLLVPGVFTIAGMLLAGYEWTWIVTNQPYGGKPSVYGSGTWLHYFKDWNRVTPFGVLLLSISSVFFFEGKKKPILLALYLSGFGIVLLHVILWKYGTMGSAGLHRTLVTSVPALGLLAAYTASRLYSLKQWSLPVILAFYILELISSNRFPSGVSDREFAAVQMAEKVEARGLLSKDRRFAYQFSTVAFYLNLDPFDSDRVIRLWSLDKHDPSGNLNGGDVLIWDNVTGHREGMLSWDRIKSNTSFQRLDSVTVGNVTLVSFLVNSKSSASPIDGEPEKNWPETD